MYDYVLPSSLDEALGQLANRDIRVVAGGTDFYPAQGDNPFTGSIIDISRVADLRGIDALDSGWRIGALTTWSDIVQADLPPLFRGLQLAAKEVGARSIQNIGTIAGNLCNASPAADGVPPLLALNAEVELRSCHGSRHLPLDQFIKGNRQTDCQADELLTAIIIPRPTGKACGHFLKLGSRSSLVISIVMVAGMIEVDDSGCVSQARLAVGSCSLVAKRLTALEQALLGQPLNMALVDKVNAEHIAALTPIDDVRASADYRLQAAEEMVRRVLADCVKGLQA